MDIEDVLREFQQGVDFPDPILDQKMSAVRDLLAGLGIPHITRQEARACLTVLALWENLTSEGQILLSAYLGTQLDDGKE